jgi:hypothetical protein
MMSSLKLLLRNCTIGITGDFLPSRPSWWGCVAVNHVVRGSNPRDGVGEYHQISDKI